MPDIDSPMDLQQDDSSTSGTGDKRKRSFGGLSPGPPSAKKLRSVYIRQPKKPKKPSHWRLPKEKVPAEAENTKLALQTHIRILWNLPHQKAIPPSITDEDRALVNRIFTSEADIKVAVGASLSPSLDDVGNTQATVTVKNFLASLPSGSTVSTNIKRMDERYLLFMFRTVSTLGLKCWAPDILDSGPNSMYNLLHEHIALTTFQQVSAGFGYSHLRNNQSIAQDFPLMRKFYRNFVYFYMHKIAKSEAKKPGSVARSKDMINVWKRRTELKDSRIDAIKTAGFGGRVVALARETEAHSDDELPDDNVDADSGGQAYFIKEKEGRSLKAARFYRMLDADNYQKALAKGHYHRLPRRRKDPPISIPSQLSTRPQKIPVDWFEPTYWNTALTPLERAQYLKNGIVISLPLDHLCETWEQCISADWKKLPEMEFMEKYGNAVLAQYHIPTPDEIKKWEEDNDSEDGGGEQSAEELEATDSQIDSIL